MKKENIKFKAKRLDNGEWIIGSFVVMKIPALSKTTIGIVAEVVQRCMKLHSLPSVSLSASSTRAARRYTTEIFLRTTESLLAI